MQRYLLIYMKEEDLCEEFEVSHYKTLNELIADNPEAIGKDEVYRDAWVKEDYCIVNVSHGIVGTVAEEIEQPDLEAAIFAQEEEEEAEEEEGWIPITINGLQVKVPKGTTWTDIVEKIGSALHNQALGCNAPTGL